MKETRASVASAEPPGEWRIRSNPSLGDKPLKASMNPSISSSDIMRYSGEIGIGSARGVVQRVE